MRIGIAGCAGTGKSVLAERLASELGVPFLPAKEITGDILRRDGYDYASGQQVEKFLATQAHQEEILRRTREQQSAESFVTDRTAIDLAAYAILEMDGPLNVQRYLEQCRELIRAYTHLFLCPWECREIVDNHKRTLDPWYQFAVHCVEREVATMFEAGPIMLVNRSSVDDRVKGILEWIKAVREDADVADLLRTM
jgi:predicted ATPase